MPNLVIYHGNCIDGFTAAWAAWKKFRFEDTEYFAASHHTKEDFDIDHVRDKNVYILDFSFNRGMLTKMYDIARSMKVLDHHKTAELDLRDLPFCKFDMQKCGAKLAWEFFHDPASVPLLVEYVEDRDLWKWELEHSKEVNAYIGIQQQTFESWNKLSLMTHSDLVECGKIVRETELSYIHQQVGNHYLIQEWEGFTSVPVVNISSSRLVSETLHELARPIAVSWWKSPEGKFVYSLRSIGDVDVGKIAKKYNGGGHKNAAGFELDRLIF